MDTVNKHNDFVQEYKQEFENDLNPDSRNFPATLAELTEKLKAWKTILQVGKSTQFDVKGYLVVFVRLVRYLLVSSNSIWPSAAQRTSPIEWCMQFALLIQVGCRI